MAASLDFYSNYMLSAAVKEIVPKKSFFKDRYFPTEAGDIFNADKVLVEFENGDRKMAAFVSDRVGDIPVDRMGYRVSEYAPAKIAPSRILTLDDLKKRGFGEALYAGDDQATRAAKLQVKDMSDLDGRIVRREEWMAAQTMINNACTMQSMIDGVTEGEQLYVRFYETTSDHTYTVASGHLWDGTSGDIYGDVEAMCGMLSERGLEAADLVLGSSVAKVFRQNEAIRADLNTTSGVRFGVIDPSLTEYAGVVFMGQMNFGGFVLNVFSADETYVDDNGTTQKYFPAKSAMVAAPKCGHMMYGSVTQIPYGSTEFETVAAKRVPKLVIDQENDTRKVRLVSRPIAAPKAYCPWIYAANVIS